MNFPRISVPPLSFVHTDFRWAAAKPKLYLTVLCFLLVASLRLCLIHFFAFDSPYSDQWDAEGWTWLRSFRSGTIDWSMLFAPHNEHRIAFVRLVSLGLFALNNSQWDNLVSATLNALLVAAAGAFVFRTMLASQESNPWPMAFCVIAAFCIPFGFENLLLGFQLEFFLLIALAVLGIWIAASREINVWNTLLLGLVAYASLFSLASGLFTPIAITLAILLRLRVTPHRWRAAAPLLLLLVSATVVGRLLLVDVAAHANLRAQNFREWLAAVSMVASWPLPASWFGILVMWFPTTVGAVTMFRNRRAGPEITALSIGAWTAMQIAGIAYGRAHDMMQVHSRYTDILALTVLVNVFFCLHLLRSTSSGVNLITRVAIASLWLTAAAGGYAFQTAIALKEMQDFAASRRTQTENIRQYLATSNPAVLDAAMPWNLPYPNKARLKMMLDDGTIRDMLPAGVRRPLSLGGYSGGFSVNGMPVAVVRPRGQGAYGSFALNSGADNTAVMTSGVLHSRFPYLQFAVAGFPGSEGLQLEVKSGGTSSVVAPASPPGEAWKEIAVAKSSVDFSVSARDDSHTQWLAFAPPVEIGRLSQWTRGLLAASPFLLLAVLAAICFLILFTWLIRAQAAGRGNNTDSGSPAADAE